MNTEFTGKKLVFSYMSDKDLPFVSGMLEKTSVCEWLFFGPNKPEVTRSYFEPLISGIKKDISENRLPPAPVFTICDKKTGCFAGQCALLPVDFSDGAYLIGYQLGAGIWCRGMQIFSILCILCCRGLPVKRRLCQGK